MLDTTSITTEITKLIACGTPEGELLFRIARRFPDLSWAELSARLYRKRPRRQSARRWPSIEVTLISRRYQDARSERVEPHV